MSQITVLLERLKAGDPDARDRLFSVAYEELRRLARARLRHAGRDPGMDTVAVLSESYLRFARGGRLHAEDRHGFFAYVSRVMRSVIIENVRLLRAQRRGGGVPHLELSPDLADSLAVDDGTVRKVREALEALEQAEPRLGRVAQLRFFEGYSAREIARKLEITERTVQRDWKKARLLLAAQLGS
jgi:RNA polymerase sigma factor (TIGR02999 family)